MIRRPPGSTRTDTRIPYTTLFRALLVERRGGHRRLRKRPHQPPPSLPDCGVHLAARALAVGAQPPAAVLRGWRDRQPRSEEHTSELQSLMRISYAVFCLKKKTNNIQTIPAHAHKRHNKLHIT